MKSRSSVFALPVAGIVCASCASHRDFAGPAPVRNQHPAQLAALHLDPIGAEALAEGEVRLRVDAAYSSYFLAAGQGSGASARSIQLDGELLRVGYKARIGLSERVELDAELPVAFANGGFLDEWIVDYHAAFGFPDQGRDTALRDRFAVRATRDGRTAYEMNPGALEVLDVPLALAWHVFPCDADHPVGLAVRGGVEIPVGDTGRGYGNGHFDTALGLTGEARVGPCSLTAFVQHAFVGSPLRARVAGVPYEDVASAGLGLETLLAEGLSVLVQAELESSVLENVALRQASHAQGTVFLGGRIALGRRTALELGLVEDWTRKTSPDFTGYVALAFRP